MNKVVLDASAMLALLNEENGYEIVEQHLTNSVMSTVNLSEVVSVLMDIGISKEEAETTTAELLSEIIAFDQQQAYAAASLRKITKPYGLSLGDRACLALGKIKNLPVITADKAWTKISQNIKIICIR
jgi:ribonuclease VapC